MRTLMVLFAIAPILAHAQEPVSRGDVVELTAEIVSIDHDLRLITLEDEDGETEEIYAGPEVKRFDELKVGDEVADSASLELLKDPASAGSEEEIAAQMELLVELRQLIVDSVVEAIASDALEDAARASVASFCAAFRVPGSHRSPRRWASSVSYDPDGRIRSRLLPEMGGSGACEMPRTSTCPKPSLPSVQVADVESGRRSRHQSFSRLLDVWVNVALFEVVVVAHPSV